MFSHLKTLVFKFQRPVTEKGQPAYGSGAGTLSARGTGCEEQTMSRYWYFISNRSNQQCIDIVSSSPERACGEVGWNLDDCVVITVGEIEDRDSEDAPSPAHPESPPPARRRGR